MPAEARVHKVLVTGDREWSDISRVVEELQRFVPGTILVHGACRGADITCAAVAEALGFEVRGYPADWEKHKKAAGPIRNQQMLDVENKPEEPIDLCLAFHNDIDNSRGTADMLKRARLAGISCKLCSSRSSPEHLVASGVDSPNVTNETAVEHGDCSSNGSDERES